MKPLHNYIKPLLLAPALLLSVISCKKDDHAVATDNLQSLISKDTTLSIFSEVMKRTHLTTFTTGPGPFTIFAPTNTAYAQAGIHSISDLNSLDSDNLVVQTTWLIAPGSFTADVLVGFNVPIATQAGSTSQIFASAYDNGTWFNGNKARQRDVPASNGVLQVMDDFLTPTSNTTTATLALYPDKYKLWLQAITKAGLATSTTTNRTTTTLFAPTNTAMLAAGYDSVTISKSTTAVMAKLVKYHTIGSRYFLFSLENNASYKTDLGTSVTIAITGNNTIVKGTNNNAAVILRDLTTTNGVIQTIDTVLQP